MGSKKIVVIDGQGGRLGALVVAELKKRQSGCEIIAVGTNASATAAMMKAGADAGATGENPAVVNCRNADVIVGPIGILAADALLGEVTGPMAAAVGRSPAEKVLIPVNRCNHHVAGVENLSMAEMVERATELVASLIDASSD